MPILYPNERGNVIETQISNQNKAIIFALATTISYSIMGALVKLVSKSTTPDVIVFFRFFVGMLFVIPMLSYRVKQNAFSFKTKRPWVHLVRGLAGFFTLVFMYAAFEYLPLVNVVLLNNTYPLFMPFIAWAWLGVRSPMKLYLFVLIGFVGVMLVLRPGHALFQWPAVLALMSGICATVAIFSTRQLSKTENNLLIMFYYFLISIILSGSVVMLHWHGLSSYAWILLIAIGLVATVYQITLTRALRLAPARVVSPIMYISLIISGFLDWLIWNHIPDVLSIIGMIIVTVGAIGVILSSSKIQTKPA